MMLDTFVSYHQRAERWDLKCSPPENPCYQRRHIVLQVVANRRTVVAIVGNFNEDVADEGENFRPWYMSGKHDGPYRRRSELRMALLWSEEDPGSDRITNQVMFVPPSPLQAIQMVIGSKDIYLLRTEQLVPPKAWQGHVQKRSVSSGCLHHHVGPDAKIGRRRLYLA